MAYRITYGNSVVYEAGNDSRAVHDAKMALSAEGISTLDFTVPPTHPLAQSFTVNNLNNLVDVTFDGKLLFRGIVTRLSTGMDKEVTVHCDSELIRLQWVMARSDVPSVRTAETLLSWCVQQLSAATSGTPVLGEWEYYTNISDTDTDVGYPANELDGRQAVGELPASPTNLLSLLVDNVVNKYGCLLYIDYDRYQGAKTITLRKPTTSTAAQTIRLGENLTDYLQQVTTEDMYTAAYAVGSDNGGLIYERSFSTNGWFRTSRDVGIGDEQILLEEYDDTRTIHLYSGDYLMFGSASDYGKWVVKITNEVEFGYGLQPSEWVNLDRAVPEFIPAKSPMTLVRKDAVTGTRTLTLDALTNRSVTEGGRTYKKVGNVVYDQAAESLYGVKMLGVSSSETLLAYDLLQQAINELRQVNRPQATIEIGGVDMAMYSSNKTHLRAGDAVRVISEPHGLDEVMLVRKIDVDLDDPGQNTYSIGKAMPTATGQIRGAYGETASVRERVMRQYR